MKRVLQPSDSEGPPFCQLATEMDELGKTQEHYGQKLKVGAVLESFVKQAGWRVIYSSGPVLEKPAQLMAELHLANIRSWRHDKYASQSFDAGEDGLT